MSSINDYTFGNMSRIGDDQCDLSQRNVQKLKKVIIDLQISILMNVMKNQSNLQQVNKMYFVKVRPSWYWWL